MKNIIKVLCGCFAVVIIFTIFIVPVTMAFTSSPSYTCGFETNADYNNYKSRARILKIRDTGLTNMFDTTVVQRLAFEREFYELVMFIEEHKKEYVRFIIYGDR